MQPSAPLVLLALFAAGEQCHVNKHVHVNFVLECAMWGACGVAHRRINFLSWQSGHVTLSSRKRSTAVISFLFFP